MAKKISKKQEEFWDAHGPGSEHMREIAKEDLIAPVATPQGKTIREALEETGVNVPKDATKPSDVFGPKTQPEAAASPPPPPVQAPPVQPPPPPIQAPPVQPAAAAAAPSAAVGGAATTTASAFAGLKYAGVAAGAVSQAMSGDLSGAVGRAAGGVAGGMAGSAVGSAVGAAIGSVVPVLGTAVGAAVGGSIGGGVGAAAGGEMGSKALHGAPGIQSDPGGAQSIIAGSQGPTGDLSGGDVVRILKSIDSGMKSVVMDGIKMRDGGARIGNKV